ncbi:MAG: hypothetical protein AAFR96_09150 [Planctomycetota bacterium]
MLDQLTRTATIAIIDSSNLIPTLAIGGTFLVGGIAVLGGVYNSISTRRQVEKSRREIAAYIAEGSMTPEEGERLLNAGPGEKSKC